MQRVLVPFDFSPHARRALALAMQGFPFGPALGVEILHVVDDNLYRSAMSRSALPSDDAIRSYLESEIAKLEAEVTVARGGPGPELVQPTVEIVHGDPYERIEARLETPTIVAVSLGGQGHGGASERVLGRTAQRVIRHANKPAYAVKNPSGLLPPRKLVVATDGSEASATAVRAAVRVQLAGDVALSVVHAVDSPMVPYVRALASQRDSDAAVAQLRSEARADLTTFTRDVLRDLRPRSLEEIVLVGSPAKVIAAHAAEHGADLIVTGTRSTNVLSKILLGSTAEQLIAAARCDVLVIPSQNAYPLVL